MNIPLNIDWQQILLHLFNFVILFAVLYFLLYSPVKKFMDERQKHFADLENEAQDKLSKSESVLKEYQTKLDGVSDEIAEMKKKAMSDVKTTSNLKLEQAQKEADKIINDAKIAIERDRKKMISNARNEISELVAETAEKIVSKSDTLASYDAFLDAVKRGESDD